MIVYEVQKLPTAYSAPLQIRYYPAPEAVYEKLKLKDQILREQGKSLSQVDLIAICEDEHFQKMDFEVLGPCRWRTQALSEGQALLADYQRLIELSVARKITEKQFLDARAQAGLAAPAPQTHTTAPQQPVARIAQAQPAAPQPQQLAAAPQPQQLAAAPTLPSIDGMDLASSPSFDDLFKDGQ